MKDSDIIRLYLNRREEAISETQIKYDSYLHKVAYTILRNVNDAEEIVNDTYMGAWNAIPPTIPKQLKIFLSRITRNLSMNRLDYLTAGKRQAIFVELDEALPDCSQMPETIWEVQEIGRMINLFLGTLDKKSGAIFIARYYYAYTIQELADDYGLSERQVKYNLAKSRKKLKTYLERNGVSVHG